jgi:hypothetical protein
MNEVPQVETPPSGRWVGYYTHAGSQVRHRMDLDLAFAQGRIRGDGGDDIGPFLISGVIHPDRKATWTKTYPGSHDVRYQGFVELGGIWGTWSISPYSTGGFRIWPGRLGIGDSLITEEEQPLEVDPVEVPAMRTGR